MNIEIYSKANCGYCIKAKNLATKLGHGYTEISALDNRDELFARVKAAIGNDPKTLPQIFIDGAYIGGYSEMEKHFG